MNWLYESTDPATKIGEIIGTILAIGIYVGIVGIVFVQALTR